MFGNTRQPCDEALARSHPDVRDCSQAVGNWVLAAAILGSSITFIDGTVVNVVLPVLQRELGADVTQAQWVVESYALMLAALILVGGVMGDRLGRQRVFSAGVVLFALASIWCGLARNITELIVARGVQGVGAALLVPGSLALISANFSKESRGRAIGTWSGFTSIAAGIGPVLGGWLVQRFSWRWIFFINISLALAVLAITWLRVPESRDQQAKGRVDWLGATLATIGLGGVVFGLIESETDGFYSHWVIASLALGIMALAGFVFAEVRQQDPMMPLELFRSRTFAGANLLTLFLYAALGGLFFFLPFNLIQVQGYSPAAVGAALLPFVLTMFLLSRWAGGLVARYGPKLPLVVGPMIVAAGFALFAVPGAQAGSYWTSFFPAVMVLSVGMAISVAPLTTTVMSAVEERHAGVASGINNAVSRAAALLAIAVLGVLMFKTFQGNLGKHLESLPVAPETREQLIQQSGALFNLKIPGDLTREIQAAIRQAVRESFVAGFRVVTYAAAGLAALSALVSWLLIGNETAAPQSRQKK
ncbi:MAG: MFS transporter [Acidobacteriales bacterium]|nr:MFS transporter [Terriglobales bacterium]